MHIVQKEVSLLQFILSVFFLLIARVLTRCLVCVTGCGKAECVEEG